MHRWLGLSLGTLAVVLGISGAVLAIDPVQQAWQAPAAPSDLTVATLVERVMRTVPDAEEIRHLPSGAIVVFSFAGEQPQAAYVDPADGRVLGPWQASALPRWVKNLHRSWLLDDAGRWLAAGTALAMAVLCASALVLLLRRMGGWRRLTKKVRGTLAQRLHVLTGRVVLLVLLLTSVTALTMSASTLGLVVLDAGTEPEVLSVVSGQPALPGAQLAPLQSLRAQDLRKLNVPGATDPEDTWKLTTAQGQGWIGRCLGHGLAGGRLRRRPGHGAAHGDGCVVFVAPWCRLGGVGLGTVWPSRRPQRLDMPKPRVSALHSPHFKPPCRPHLPQQLHGRFGHRGQHAQHDDLFVRRGGACAQAQFRRFEPFARAGQRPLDALIGNAAARCEHQRGHAALAC